MASGRPARDVERFVMNERVYWTTMPSPVGLLTLTSRGDALTGVRFGDAPPLGAATRDDARLAGARRQLDEYFRGERTSFDLPLALVGTPFQLRVWQALREIPFGETASYGMVARRIGRASAVRAVGAANRNNPIAIVVPCHRVIGADGSLTGFGGGLPRKRFLLELESAQRNEHRPPRWGAARAHLA